MSDNKRNYIPILDNVFIQKDGNRWGKIVISSGSGAPPQTLTFDGSFPFSRTDPMGAFVRSGKEPASDRMAFFQKCVFALVGAFDGKVAPTRFYTSDGTQWKMDKACTPWLVNSGRWVFVSNGHQDDFALRQL